MECIFCKIIKGEIPSYTIYEDDVVKVFLDVNPDNNGHTLIVPKKHYLDLYDIPLDVLSHINKVSKEIAKLLDLSVSSVDRYIQICKDRYKLEFEKI